MRLLSDLSLTSWDAHRTQVGSFKWGFSELHGGLGTSPYTTSSSTAASLCNGSSFAGDRLEARMSLGVGSTFTSWAVLLPADRREGEGQGGCRQLKLQYFDVGRDLSGSKHVRQMGTPPLAHVVAAASSVVLLSVGTHGNTRAALHHLWARDVLPYLEWLNRTSSNADAPGARDAASDPLAKVVWLDSTSRLLKPGSTIACRKRGVCRVPCCMRSCLWPWPCLLSLSPEHSHRLYSPSRASRTTVPPQHFDTPARDGSYDLRMHLSGDSPGRRECISVDPLKAAWRNDAFAAWLHDSQHDGRLPRERWGFARTFEVFLNRKELHPKYRAKGAFALGHFYDCTHYCFTPFLYEPVWALIARAL
jgi:hypothetical protein